MINDLPFTDIAAARAGEKEMTANLPMCEPARPVDVRDSLVPGQSGFQSGQERHRLCSAPVP
ncbi:hypothetical protein UK15_33270 [Streptomyces variegatus]|uniref:Uncharacterized protein n=1 Tax=Streptomyces variegatus TaxID=284040 RepID=A0A0M2GJ04_9ACTN|nr:MULTISPECIES: hypothetical protein [Streptomyces]KJK35036.1 hypothetical protein UK15_33270 [Streptomyces variegatus]